METKQTEYEKQHGRVSRIDLIKNVKGMMDKLNDDEFHSFYILLWSMTYTKTLYRIAQKDRKRLQKQVNEE